MNEPIEERCLLIKSINEECQNSFSSLEQLYEIIQAQDSHIKKLEEELRHNDMVNKHILLENAQYSIETLKTLLHIIWPLTKKPDFQQFIINNTKFIELLFDNLQSAKSSDLLFPLIGILSNLNSNKSFRLKIGFDSVFLSLESDCSKIVENFECCQVFLYLLYNVSLDINILFNLLKKSPLLDFLKENSLKVIRFQELQNLFFRFLWQISNSLLKNIFDEVELKNAFLLEIKEICIIITINEKDDPSKIIQAINKYLIDN